MSGVATNGLPILQTTASGYISYQYKVWNPYKTWVSEGHYDGDEWHDTSHYVGGYDFFNATSNAVDTGSVNASSSNVFVNGSPVVTHGDSTTETWTNTGFNAEFVSASPSTDGSGSGNVDVGGTNVYVNGKMIASDGSPVNTVVGTRSQIQGGSSNVFVNS